MALLKDGKIFYIKCGIKDYTDEYGANHTLEEYFNWFRQQFINTLNISAEDFWMKWDNNSPFFQLPYINEPHPYAKLVLYLNTSISKTTLLSSVPSEAIKLEVGNADITSVHDTYVNWTSHSIVNIYAYNNENNGDHVASGSNYYIYLETNYYTTFIIDTNFLKTHNFYTIGGISDSYKLTEYYVAPTILVCNIINKFNSEYYDGIIFLWSSPYDRSSAGDFPEGDTISSFKFNTPSICALIPDFDKYEDPNDFRTYSIKGFYPQLFTADESSFSIVKIHFGKMRPVSNIYLTKVTNTSLANFCYYQNMLTEKNAWKKITQIDEFNNKKTFILGLNSVIPNDIDLKSSLNWIPVIEEKKEKPQPEVKGYLEFSSDGNFILRQRDNKKYWDGIIEYSVDDGKTWNEWNGEQLSGTKSQSIYLRGINNTQITGENLARGGWDFTGKYVEGDIEALLNYQSNEYTINEYCYSHLFYDQVNLVDASKLIIKNVSDHSCYYMFYGCTSLTKTPELSATVLADSCYSYMFGNCKSLIEAPKLSATTLAVYCYSGIFRNCTSLTKAPELPATTLVANCYYQMFDKCTSLTKAPELPATILADTCYGYMFSGCTSLIEAPKLPVTVLVDSCYIGMFNNCTSLIEAPKLPAITLVYSCYNYMFYNCTSLTKIPELPATTLANNCYQYMFYNCRKVKISSTQSAEYPYEYRIPKEGTGTSAYRSLDSMFSSTGGTFKGTPTINTTYYTSNEVV